MILCHCTPNLMYEGSCSHTNYNLAIRFRYNLDIVTITEKDSRFLRQFEFG